MNIALGNQKPAALLEVEKIMWRGLFAMASGEDPNKILRDVANQISLEKLNLLPMPEREWFKLSVLPTATRQEPIPSPLLTPSLSSPSRVRLLVWRALGGANEPLGFVHAYEGLGFR